MSLHLGSVAGCTDEWGEKKACGGDLCSSSTLVIVVVVVVVVVIIIIIIILINIIIIIKYKICKAHFRNILYYEGIEGH